MEWAESLLLKGVGVWSGAIRGVARRESRSIPQGMAHEWEPSSTAIECHRWLKPQPFVAILSQGTTTLEIIWIDNKRRWSLMVRACNED